MTRERTYGSESAFSDWLRNQVDLDAKNYDLCINDVDHMFHRFRIHTDGIGTRKIQCMMLVETKVFGGMPNENQLQTLYFYHQSLQHWNKRTGKYQPKVVELYDNKNREMVKVLNFGVHVLIFPATYPGQEKDYVYWCRWNQIGVLARTKLTVPKLKEVLRFDIRPDNFKPISDILRRHHKDTPLVVVDSDGLFPVEREVIKRS